jgi:hypothetical protein
MPKVRSIALFEEKRKSVGKNPKERRRIGTISIPGKGKAREANLRAINRLLGNKVAGRYVKGKFRKR